MFENFRDSVEVPIELRCRKVRPEEEEPLQLRRLKQRERRWLDVELSLWSESHFYAGLSGDAAEAGLFVATYRPLHPGESVVLRFELFGEPIEIDGMVRWRRAACEHAPPGVAIALANVPPRARKLIAVFCAQRAPIYYELGNGASGSA